MRGDPKLNNIGTNLQKLRKNKNLYQSDISESLGISQPTYSLYEKGKREPAADMLIKIADFFNISLDELMR